MCKLPIRPASTQSRRADMHKRTPIFVLLANHHSSLQPPLNLGGYAFTSTPKPHERTSTPHRLLHKPAIHVRVTAWPWRATACSPVRLAPQPRNLLPDATPHCSVPRMPSSVTFQARATTVPRVVTPLEFLGGKYLQVLQGRVHQQLAVCCAYPWVSCERHRTAYAGPPEGTLRRYVVCRVNRMHVFLGPSMQTRSASCYV